jgi:hypothetical protein
VEDFMDDDKFQELRKALQAHLAPMAGPYTASGYKLISVPADAKVTIEMAKPEDAIKSLKSLPSKANPHAKPIKAPVIPKSPQDFIEAQRSKTEPEKDLLKPKPKI